ncbi:Galactose mutarotase [Gillisia sp. Hel1_33_143]|uniref:aldose 1-epimerase family protein n=1 Tax=Gillisia sp. Hel1_33_143 TaxID=1336796 RepID=UPI00087AC85E|nr:aldose 1-epimerase family protein [Gillisia sp. Hel1_33_143]SDS40884.1 Galactose mutarotase [Gillisia sp. Hel1_33_143]
MYSLENKKLSLKVKPTGAELCSIINKENGLEHIWQGDPTIWKGHAPVLFPIVGNLKDDEFIFEGNAYSMPRHGIFRHSNAIELIEQTTDRLTFSFKYSEETLKQYPFKFEFQLSYILTENTVEVKHEVINLDSKPIYFSVGAHPAFNLPLFEGEEYQDYYLEFDKKLDLKTYLLSPEGLVSEETEEIISDSETIQLHKDLFLKDALIFKDISSKNVVLMSKKHGPVLEVNYPDFKNLGLWSKPGADYVCIEPWLGIADGVNTKKDLKTKEDINKLMPSETFNASYSIAIK